MAGKGIKRDTGGRTMAVEGMNLREHAYGFIRQGLMEGRWSGDDPVSTVRLAADIGTSLIPVREAIVQLETEGLVEKVENKGIRAKRLDRSEVQDMFDVRCALESKAAELAAKRITAEELAKLEENCEQMLDVLREIRRLLKQDAGSIVQENSWVGPVAGRNFYLNSIFHMIILRASRNMRLIRTVGNLHVLSQSLKNFYVLLPVRNSLSQVTRDVAHHRRICRAIRAQDPAGAAHWMVRHVEEAQRYHLAAYDLVEAQSRMQKEAIAPQYAKEILNWLEGVERDST